MRSQGVAERAQGKSQLTALAGNVLGVPSTLQLIIIPGSSRGWPHLLISVACSEPENIAIVSYPILIDIQPFSHFGELNIAIIMACKRPGPHTQDLEGFF